MSEKLVIFLAGNKADFIDERTVPYSDAEEYARENDLLFAETSAKLGTNVTQMFLAVGKMISKKVWVGFQLTKKNCFFHTFRGKTTGNPCRKTRNRAWNKSYRKQGRIKCMVWKNMQLLNSSPCGKVKTVIKVVKNKWKYALCRMKDQFWICKLFS